MKKHLIRLHLTRGCAFLATCSCLLLAVPAEAQRRDREAASIPRSFDRKAKRPDSRPPKDGAPNFEVPAEYRAIDGTGNNTVETAWGAAEIVFERLVTPAYADGVDAPARTNLASPRAISNAVAAQTESIPNDRGATDYLWQWGQFLDHDIDETPASDPGEPFDIAIPAGDPFFDPTGSGTASIPLNRSFGEAVDGVRRQLNAITAYIDASNVYGSDEERAFALRTLDGTGKLKTSEGDLLPFNEAGLPNAPSGQIPTFFLAGDVRANEQAALICMHTLFVREHNYWADQLNAANPELSGEEVYQIVRAIVGAEMQAITYREFLPVLLGHDALPRYEGYDPAVNPGIANVFATAAYRVGHTMLSENLLRLDADGNEAPEGNLPLASAFFAPGIVVENGIDSILRGLAGQACQQIDTKIVDAVRNFLFGPPGSGGFDLASLNIQRGRDHGLPSYNQVRIGYGLAPVGSFAEISRDSQVQAALQEVYASVNDIDPWGCN